MRASNAVKILTWKDSSPGLRAISVDKPSSKKLPRNTTATMKRKVIQLTNLLSQPEIREQSQQEILMSPKKRQRGEHLR